jgi:hypothetical protein
LKATSKPTGLRYWMLRVLDECDNVAADFSADPVHDLRVALRRCRSLADGMMAMDPDPSWKAMKKAGKRLFQRLGALRDIQIMMEWIEKLELNAEQTPALVVLPQTLPDAAGDISAKGEISATFVSSQDHSHDSAAQALLYILKGREAEQKREARAALEEFDRKQWRQWSRSLPIRTSRIWRWSAGPRRANCTHGPCARARR